MKLSNFPLKQEVPLVDCLSCEESAPFAFFFFFLTWDMIFFFFLTFNFYFIYSER